MADQALLTRALSEFAHTLVRPYEIGDVLYHLADRTAEVLGVAGAGVSLVGDDDRLRFVSATDEATSRVERAQEETDEGPCHDAHRTGNVVLVADLAEVDAWPRFRDEATKADLHAVAGIPMRLEGLRLGVLDIYDAKPKQWADDDIAAARLLADIATSYVFNARELEQSRRLAHQLQRALDSRVVIEQAKGIIAARQGISVSEAFQVLRNHARNHNLELHAAAESVVDRGAQL